MFQKDPFAPLPEGLDFQVNPYAKSLVDAEHNETPAFFGPQLQAHRGRWKEVLGCEKLILEVGVHKGVTLIQLAKHDASLGCLGMDITFKRVMTTAKRLLEQGLHRRCASIFADARFLAEIFEPGELDGVLMFFPDPWIHKKGMTHKRLFQQSFCDSIKKTLHPNGFFWFKSDSWDYSKQVQEILKNSGFVQGSGCTPLAVDFSSSFEKRFHDQGLDTDSHWWKIP